LVLHRCLACGTLQVIDPPAPEVLFHPDYPYRSGSGFVEHAAALARIIALRTPLTVLDIGSNDGTFVRALQAEGIAAWGIDATHPAAEIRGFFPAVTVGWNAGSLSMITALNVLAHVPDPKAFAREVARLLMPGGWFIVEVSDLAHVLAGARIDTLYHEHQWTWSRAGLTAVLVQAGLGVQRIEALPAQGGSMRLWVQKGQPATWVSEAPYLRTDEPYERAWATWVSRCDAVRACLTGRWAGYGAAAKGAMFAYHMGFTPTTLAYVIDETVEKHGRLTPWGAPIMPPEHLAIDPPDGVLILAWNYARGIRAKLRDFGGSVLVV
jgi:methylation protein EvaC